MLTSIFFIAFNRTGASNDHQRAGAVVSRALPFTQAGVVRAIKAVEAAGRFVLGVKPDGTLIIGNKPIDTGSLVPVELEQSPRPPGRRFGEKINGDQSEG